MWAERLGSYSNTLDLRGDTVFVTTEINHAVVMAMTCHTLTNRDTTIVVTASFLELRLQQRRVRFAFVQVIACD